MRNTRLIVSTILAISAATVVGGCMNNVPDPATTETKPETVIETSEMPEQPQRKQQCRRKQLKKLQQWQQR